MVEHPAGWYRDSEDLTLVREWDGKAWTGQTKRIPNTPVQVPLTAISKTLEATSTITPVSVIPTIASDDEPISHENLYANKREVHILESKPFRFRDSNRNLLLLIVTLLISLTLGAVKNSGFIIFFLVIGFWFYWVRNEKNKALSAINLEISQNDVTDLELNNKELENFNKHLSKYAVLEAFALDEAIKLLKTEREFHKSEFLSEKTIDESIILELSQRIKTIRQTLIETEDTAILQEVGVYNYFSELSSATAYKVKWDNISNQIHEAIRKNTAVNHSFSFTLNGNSKEGEKMVKEFSKLMLRAYNGEADDALRTLKPYKVQSSIDMLEKVKSAIEKLGGRMGISISPDYHNLRVSEMKIKGDFLEKQAEEKEEEKARREMLKEEERVQKELQNAKDKLEKEQSHYQRLFEQAESSGNEDAKAKAIAKLSEVADSIANVDKRAANIRVGHVYVISNIGSFGEGVVKIGLTRRLAYEERIHELSGASVPFEFDIHAIVFSEDAVSLETNLHRTFNQHRVNKVNSRKEFFRVAPKTVKDEIEKLTNEHLLVYNEVPLAKDWRMSQSGNIVALEPVIDSSLS